MKIHSNVPVRIAKTGYIMLAFVLLALGIFFVTRPHIAAITMVHFGGVLMIVMGAIKLVGYFSKDLYRLAFQYDLQFGILLTVIGIIFLVKAESTMDFLCVALGIVFLGDSMFRISVAFEGKRFGIRQWRTIFYAALMVGLMAVILIFRPETGENALLTVLGLTLIAEAVLMLLVAIFTVKIIRRQWSEEMDYIE